MGFQVPTTDRHKCPSFSSVSTRSALRFLWNAKPCNLQPQKLGHDVGRGNNKQGIAQWLSFFPWFGPQRIFFCWGEPYQTSSWTEVSRLKCQQGRGGGSSRGRKGTRSTEGRRLIDRARLLFLRSRRRAFLTEYGCPNSSHCRCIIGNKQRIAFKLAVVEDRGSRKTKCG